MSCFKSKANNIGIESLSTLGQRVIDTIINSVVEDAKKRKYFLQLVEVNERYRLSLSLPDYKDYTRKINEKLVQCEEAFLDSYDYLKGLQKSPDAEIKAAAVVLFSIVSQFGRKFRSIKAAERISRYGCILEGLQKPENEAAITATLLTEKLADFASSYEEHEILFRERGNVRSVNITASKMRNEMEEAVKLCLEDLQWQARVVGTEEWRVLCLNVEHRFDEMNVSRTLTQPEAENSATMPANGNNAETLTA